jgi:hypothetical protein
MGGLSDPIAIIHAGNSANGLAYIPTSGLDKNYYLAFDITLGSTWTAIGSGAVSFTGTLDGRGHTITVPSGGTTITPSLAGYAYDTAGLFGFINGSSARITDLTLAGGTFTTAVQAGNGLVMGGIVGWMSDGTILNCAVRINIDQNSPDAASGSIGGIAGISAGTIQNCYSTGAINVIIPSSVHGNLVSVGGIVGDNSNTIENCYSTGNISGSSYETSAGGIAGSNSSSVPIRYCYATGNVTGYSPGSDAGFYGGIVGRTTDIENCVALNGNIATTDTSPNRGRVYGNGIIYSTFADNYGRTDMQVNNTAGSWISNATGIDGGNVSMGTTSTQANNSAWWTSPAGWTINPTVAAASDGSPWIWGANLPKLYWE